MGNARETIYFNHILYPTDSFGSTFKIVKSVFDENVF